ncbi:MAG: class A beta-lactamase-related serine hydrolase [Chitinophagaceae bacterium]|nr:MAG: class A beta-lactamase-related serine hydrolase [Chitinophagaceae bacterium]
MKSVLFVVLIALIFACNKKNDEVPTPTPEPYDFSAVEKVLDDSVPAKYGGNCYAVIHVDGKTVFSKGYGEYNGSTKMYIASCTKWLSGALIMSLVDEGKLSLSDTIGKFLPIFTANGKGHVPIRYLFSHCSGFPGDSDDGYESNPLITMESAVDQIAMNVPLRIAPGTVFNYGSVSMQIGGRIAEIVSGKSFFDLIQEKIFTPCGMTNTDFAQATNPLVAGGARSTPDDFILFLDMIMRKGVTANGTRVLSEQSVIEMEKDQTNNARLDQVPYPDGYVHAGIYGIGNWRDMTDNADNLIENSSPGVFGSHPWVNRSKKLTGFIFTFILSGTGTSTLPTSIKVRGLARDAVN